MRKPSSQRDEITCSRKHNQSVVGVGLERWWSGPIVHVLSPNTKLIDSFQLFKPGLLTPMQHCLPMEGNEMYIIDSDGC